ncbi:unnamed protein product, partial [Arabidopsis halleri]
MVYEVINRPITKHKGLTRVIGGTRIFNQSLASIVIDVFFDSGEVIGTCIHFVLLVLVFIFSEPQFFFLSGFAYHLLLYSSTDTT